MSRININTDPIADQAEQIAVLQHRCALLEQHVYRMTGSLAGMAACLRSEALIYGFAFDELGSIEVPPGLDPKGKPVNIVNNTIGVGEDS